jgi:hypothetical protein
MFRSTPVSGTSSSHAANARHTNVTEPTVRRMRNTIRVPQDRESPLQPVKAGPFTGRYAYARSADTRAANATGQDYLTFGSDAAMFVFAVCDGVSQSFYGDIAARLLGDALIEWLAALSPTVSDRSEVRAELGERLDGLVDPARAAVMEQALPEGLPPMLVEVLQAKRAAGSESTYVCGRIDLPTASLPYGRIILSWLGDSRLRVWGPAAECTAELGGVFETQQRWSSRVGPIGEPSVVVADALTRTGGLAIHSIAAYSDGLLMLDALSSLPSDLQLSELIMQGSRLDDISVIELQINLPPSYS